MILTVTDHQDVTTVIARNGYVHLTRSAAMLRGTQVVELLQVTIQVFVQPVVIREN